MKHPLSRRTRTVLALAVLAAALPCAALSAGAEQIVGGIEAVVFVCAPIDAKSVKPGLDLLQRAVEQRKLDLPTIRQSEPYRTAYNAEVNRLLSLPPRERLNACQHAW